MRKRSKLAESKLAELKKFLEKKPGTAKDLARVQAIFMYEQQATQSVISALTSLKRSAVLKWRNKFLSSGLESILEKPKKLRALLTKNQREQIAKMLIEQTPREYGYREDFWTTVILGHLIKERYNVQYATRKPLYILFKAARFSYHKPGHQYHKHDQQAIDNWVAANKPIIDVHIKDPDTVVLVADEMILSSKTTFQKIWLPKNSFPKIEVSDKRDRRGIYGFLNVANGSQHAYKSLFLNSESTVPVLEKICGLYSNKKIVIIWDGASYHKSQEIKDWLNKTTHKIHLMRFPTYAPELNPQEHVWKAARAKVSHNKFIPDIDKMADDFVDYLNNTRFQYTFLN